MKRSAKVVSLSCALLLLGLGASSKASWQEEWKKTVAAARNEGKLVAGIPASAELRKRLAEVFPSRFPGIEPEFTPGRGPQNANRIQAEHKAGASRVSLLISGTSTPFGLMRDGILAPVEPYLILPEVKEPDKWYGGHMWIDNAKRFIYSFQAYQADLQWYNVNLANPKQLGSYDGFLDPQWKGKIGFLDPRTPGAGTAVWSFLWKHIRERNI